MTTVSLARSAPSGRSRAVHLIAARTLDGRDGYILRTDFENAPTFTSPDQAVAWSRQDHTREINVYLEDGQTVIGQLIVGEAVRGFSARPPKSAAKRLRSRYFSADNQSSGVAAGQPNDVDDVTPRNCRFRHPRQSLILLTALGLGISYVRNLATGRPFSIGALVSVPLVYGTAALTYAYHRRRQPEPAEPESED